MVQEDIHESFEEITRSSFKRVKQHILELEAAISEDRQFIIKQNEAILQQSGKINELLSYIEQIKAKMGLFDVSSGNEGVINNHQQSSTTINNNQQQSSTTINNHQQSTTKQQNTEETGFNAKVPLSDIKKELESKFSYLTDREFSVFMAVYQLEEQLPDVTYADVAGMLKISEMTIRGYINNLMAKKIPLEKRRAYNKKVFLGITKEFRELNLASFLLTLRLPNATYVPQKTLKGY